MTYKDIHIWFQRSRYDLLALKFGGINQHFEISNTVFPYQLVNIKHKAPFEAVKECVYLTSRSSSSLLKDKTQRSYRVYRRFTQAILTGLQWLEQGFVQCFYGGYSHTCSLIKVTYNTGADVRRWRTLAFAFRQVEGGTLSFNNNNNSNQTITAPLTSLQSLYSVQQHFLTEGLRRCGNQSALVYAVEGLTKLIKGFTLQYITGTSLRLRLLL